MGADNALDADRARRRRAGAPSRGPTAGAPVARALSQRRGAARPRRDARHATRRRCAAGRRRAGALRRPGLSLSRAHRTAPSLGARARTDRRRHGGRASPCRARRCCCFRAAVIHTTRAHARPLEEECHAHSSRLLDGRRRRRARRAAGRAGRRADTLNVVTAGDQNMVDYVNNYPRPEVRER